MKLTRSSILAILALAVCICFVALSLGQMKKPTMATLKGTLIDLTCSAKGNAMMGSWGNAENNDHMTMDGKKAECATMCLTGGQPAGLFSNGKITAVFACNPRATLSKFAAQNVEVQGFWAGGEAAFVPAKIRSGSGSWQDVDCATMH